MLPTFEEFCENVTAVQARIAEACARAGRAASEVGLLVVTKTHPAAAVDYVARHGGLSGVGENRVQEAAEKKPLVEARLRWELIGHLQSNKARLATELFDRIQSVDSEKLILVLGKAAVAQGRTQSILLQVNAGNDPAKFGVDLADAPRLLTLACAQSHLQVDGLMTVAPLSDDPDVARRTFANLRLLRDQLSRESGLPLKELSMGMSGDLAPAIAEGSTQVRVGTALFGTRPQQTF